MRRRAHVRFGGRLAKRTGRNVDTAPRADPYHLKVRLDQEKLCLLVMLGVALTDAMSSSRSPTATGSPPSRGLTAARLQTARYDCPGAGCRRRRPGVLEGRAGGFPGDQRAALLVSQAKPISLLHCRNKRIRPRWQRSRMSITLRISPRLRWRSRRSRSTSGRSIPRRSPRSSTTSTRCWSSTSIQLSRST